MKRGVGYYVHNRVLGSESCVCLVSSESLTELVVVGSIKLLKNIFQYRISRMISNIIKDQGKKL